MRIQARIVSALTEYFLARSTGDMWSSTHSAMIWFLCSVVRFLVLEPWVEEEFLIKCVLVNKRKFWGKINQMMDVQ